MSNGPDISATPAAMSLTEFEAVQRLAQVLRDDSRLSEPRVAFFLAELVDELGDLFAEVGES